MRRQAARAPILIATCLAAATLAPPAAADTASAKAAPAEAARADAEQRREIALLTRQARSTDTAEALAAMQRLAEIGGDAHRPLQAALITAITRNRRTLEAAPAGEVDKLREAQQAYDDKRAELLALIKGLGKEQTDDAKQRFEALQQVHRQITPSYAQLAAAYQALAARPRLIALWTLATGGDDTAARRLNLADEASFYQGVQETLGVTPDDAEAMTAVPDAKGLHHYRKRFEDPVAAAVWHHALCRRMEAYNIAVARASMDREEQTNAAWVNLYREVLGLIPYELDPRLIQAARRHSKEMTDLDYFAHDSPTAENKSHTRRMKNAGYDHGYSENIAYGSGSGERTFWQWFHSPGHHKNMVRPESTALGVGRWNNRWTQNMGRGPYVFLMPADERDAATKIEGPVLPPGR